MPTSTSSALNQAHFAETHWSLILKATQQDESGVMALNKLCSSYRVPLYSFVRHRGFSPADAEDITQSFFLDLLERDALRQVDRQKGRFRSFLLGSLKNFLANEWDRRRTLKRGSGCTFVSLDEPEAEALYGEMGDARLGADRMFDRAWALRFLDRALNELREQYQAESRLPLFQVLEPVLSTDGKDVPYAELARQLSLNEAAVRMAGMRMRRRFRKVIRREILKTVANPADAEDELRYLFSCL
jgi:RNA polymerase sigma-70 factor (ECF subfamily)